MFSVMICRPRGISPLCATLLASCSYLLREAGARTDLRDASGRTVFDYLDIEAGPYPYRKRRAEKLRQILQNPTPAAYAPVKVSGRVAMPSGATPWASTITFQRVGLDLAEVHAAVGRDGSFEIRVIQPGPYSVLLAPAPSIPLSLCSLFSIRLPGPRTRTIYGITWRINASTSIIAASGRKVDCRFQARGMAGK